MGTIHVMEHPLIEHKLTLMRDKRTGTKEFRALLQEVAMLMAYELTRSLPLAEVTIETPVTNAQFRVIAGKTLALVPVLRAGLGMLDGILNLIPAAKVGHVGLYRDHDTLQPVEYYCKLPSNLQERDVIVVDPMLATGGSASAALTVVKRHGAVHPKLMVLVAVPEGIKKIQTDHPDVDIYTAAIDEGLNEKGYIVPGLGDAGDRLYGTF
ncbi:uracil phosphoribosyltransferase [Alicyclobacillus sp. TC]|uniref:Uracil phosphoribosyltransferase n=3 Tax=Alicyclobacillaceae TaxID=186823 RepID=A0A1M6TAH9_9BACL|nr:MULTISPECIES: uracil phosphoribosyltransferase [Alicyclobacillus]MDP9727768.1 uracil phosphoribosyltransferase [Alicyclobacillus tengchongensis]QRF24449.1 uracil phosphoribosyltransferase [Alicyclobacillus sp. TC]SHK53970.1 uracil phosphoribosyltransferase [Alicyclobacillus montanus]